MAEKEPAFAPVVQNQISDMTPEEAAGDGPTTTCMFPKDVTLMLDADRGHRRIVFPQGIREVPDYLMDVPIPSGHPDKDKAGKPSGKMHWWLKANGVTPYQNEQRKVLTPLMGSASCSPTVEIKGEAVQLAGLVQGAFVTYGNEFDGGVATAEQWNELEQEERDLRIQMEIDSRSGRKPADKKVKTKS